MQTLTLSEEGLKNRSAWEAAGYRLPAFDREAVKKNTEDHPRWIHFGAGNIFRAFQANVVQNLIEQGVMDTGLLVAEGFDYEIIEKSYRPQDNYSILVTLKASGAIEKTVIGSILQSLILDSEREEEYKALKKVFANPSLQMASFTITEKGYSLVDAKGNLLPSVEEDFQAGPLRPASYLGKVVSLLYERYCKGACPIAMVSMDNCSHNGEKLYAAVTAFAERWVAAGKAEEGFLSYVKDEKKVSFPWTMIDKITPRPDPSVEEMLRGDGLQGLDPVITSKKTYVAPFVNAEESEYLVVEDKFPNGRPALEQGGLIFTDRDTVNRVEKMKVCTCLNPLHTTLAVFGCLLGYTKISEEMKDADLKALVDRIGYTEGLPVVVDPGVIAPKEFIDTVVNVRIPNPFMPDTPQRIATDTSQKLAIRFGETIKAYEASDTLKTSDLKCIPLVFAGWIRYLLATDDAGKAFELSPDPMITAVQPVAKQFALGDTPSASEVKTKLGSLLENDRIFGVNLERVGLADAVAAHFAAMLAGPGAVREEIRKVLAS